MFHDVFNLILEYLVLPTYSIHSAHDSLIDRFGLRSFSIAVLLIHIALIRQKHEGNLLTKEYETYWQPSQPHTSKVWYG